MLKFIVLFVVVGFALAYEESYDYKYSGAPLGPDGKVVDTLEVQLAKEEHYAAYDKAKEELDYKSYKDHGYYDDSHKYYDGHY